MAYEPQRLPCGHCGAEALATPRQVKRWKSEGKLPMCSPACRFAKQQADGKARRRRSWDYGPCPTCGQGFTSRVPKTFCSMRCYGQSPQFRALVAANNRAIAAWRANMTVDEREALKEQARRGAARRGRRGAVVPCLECGHESYRQPSQLPGHTQSQKCCSRRCYRAYMAKRFDRWVANPQELALPQCYDEFLEQDELQCVVEGCAWRGVQLTTHINLAHGLPARDFKRASGFNYGTGVIARPLADKMAAQPHRTGEPDCASHRPDRTGTVINYQSLEGREHRLKAQLLARTTGVGPTRLCLGCGEPFTQRTPFGRAKYCTEDCRDEAYATQKRIPLDQRKRAHGRRLIGLNGDVITFREAATILAMPHGTAMAKLGRSGDLGVVRKKSQQQQRANTTATSAPSQGDGLQGG